LQMFSLDENEMTVANDKRRDESECEAPPEYPPEPPSESGPLRAVHLSRHKW